MLRFENGLRRNLLDNGRSALFLCPFSSFPVQSFSWFQDLVILLLANLDCRFSRPAAARGPGSADLDCRFSRPAAVRGPGSADLDCGFFLYRVKGFPLYAVTRTGISIVRSNA